MKISSVNWDSVRLPERSDRLWELYHENSKQTPFYRIKYAGEALDRILSTMHTALPVHASKRVALTPDTDLLNKPFHEVMLNRKTTRSLHPETLDLTTLSNLLFAGYGITRPDEQPRPLRTAPSGGKLYPLEIYCHATHVDTLDPGFYHYDSSKNEIQLLPSGDRQEAIASALVQQNIARDASLLIFITGHFERTIFKYGERGYRLVLLEAGHVAQNINLAATAMDLGSMNICAFYDRDMENLLEIDGVDHSILYILAVGREKK